MSDKSTFFAVIAGMVISSVITFYFTKKKYERIIQEDQEDIEAFKKEYAKRNRKPVVKAPPALNAIKESTNVERLSFSDEPPAYDITKNILKKEGYIDYSKTNSTDFENSVPMKKPYVIPPDVFGDIDEYEQISLNYYADKVLTDEDDEIIHDVEEVIGTESLAHFGEYEDDSVFVRNDRLKCDFEILLDSRNYSEIFKKGPPRHQINYGEGDNE